jgi:hypothetical protein
VLDGMSRKYGPVTIEAVGQTLYREPLEPVEKLRLGGPVQERSIMKMALNFIADAGYRFGISVLDPAFQPARLFVSEGHPCGAHTCQIDTRPLFSLPPVVGDALYNRVTVICSPDADNVAAVVEVLSELRFTMLLSHRYAGDARTFSITNLPLEQGPDEIAAVDNVTGVGTGVLLDRGSDEEWLRGCEESLRRLLARAMKQDSDSFIHRSVQEAAAAVGGDALTSENIDHFCAKLAERLVEGSLPPGVVVRQELAAEDVLDGIQESP